MVTMAITADSLVRACALAESVRVHEPGVPVALITMRGADIPSGSFFDETLWIDPPEPFSGNARYLNKLVHPFRMTPYRRTLFLDDDTLVIRPFLPVLREHFYGRSVAINCFEQLPGDPCPGINFVRADATARLTGRRRIDNLYGGGHYYFETGPPVDEVLDLALDVAVNRPDDYAAVACPGQHQIADEVAFLYAVNTLHLDMPHLPDFVDALSLKRASQIRLSVRQSRYEWPNRPWGTRIEDVRIVHFASRGKRALPYQQEIHRLTGLRQSFDQGLPGAARRSRHRARALLGLR